jgi:acetolactate synthase-1/2/3 large subunit
MEVGMPDVELLSQAYGLKGMKVRRPEEVSEAIATMLAHQGPVVLEIYVHKTENCYPMIAPGKNNAQMIGIPDRPSAPSHDVIDCPSCGATNTSSNTFCPKCGSKL